MLVCIYGERLEAVKVFIYLRIGLNLEISEEWRRQKKSRKWKENNHEATDNTQYEGKGSGMSLWCSVEYGNSLTLW